LVFKRSVRFSAQNLAVAAIGVRPNCDVRPLVEFGARLGS